MASEGGRKRRAREGQWEECERGQRKEVKKQRKGWMVWKREFQGAMLKGTVKSNTTHKTSQLKQQR